MDSHSMYSFVSDFFPSVLCWWDSPILLPIVVVRSFLLFIIFPCVYTHNFSVLLLMDIWVVSRYLAMLSRLDINFQLFRYVVTLYCGFILQLLVTNEVVQFLICLSAHLNILFCEMSVQVFCPFKKLHFSYWFLRVLYIS